MRVLKITKIEKGITLISLIIVITILVILATVALAEVTKDRGIIEQSTEKTENAKIVQYEEQIEQLERQIIVAKSILGEEITLENIAQEMEKEKTWIKSAVVNVDTSITNPDIIVTTTDGYVYQAYYSETEEVSYVEYIGIYNENTFPTVIAEYVEETASIKIVAKEEKSGIAKIELTYGGEVIESTTQAEANFKTSKNGWYKIKVTSNAEKIRYAWVKVG